MQKHCGQLLTTPENPCGACTCACMHPAVAEQRWDPDLLPDLRGNCKKRHRAHCVPAPITSSWGWEGAGKTAGGEGGGCMTSTERGMCLNWHLPHGTKSCEETGNASHVLERAHVRTCVRASERASERASSPAQPSSVLYCLHQTEKLF